MLSAGLSPLNATANIPFAELVTGGLSGGFHARRKQVSWPLVRRLAVTGSIGGATGALLLIAVTPRSVEAVRRAIAIYLLVLGVWLCWRGWRRPAPREHSAGRAGALGLVGGLFDAAGGGWGAAFSRVGTSWTGGCGKWRRCGERHERPDVTGRASCRKLGE